ncbi:MAG: hypothetical protein H6Q89_4077, partial [Myxococcaceae bacterium]|nr:hypothetical protein [Myxococcaceae bacterium]
MTARSELIPALDCLRLTLGGSKGNVLDASMIGALREALTKAKADKRV